MDWLSIGGVLFLAGYGLTKGRDLYVKAKAAGWKIPSLTKKPMTQEQAVSLVFQLQSYDPVCMGRVCKEALEVILDPEHRHEAE